MAVGGIMCWLGIFIMRSNTLSLLYYIIELACGAGVFVLGVFMLGVGVSVLL